MKATGKKYASVDAMLRDLGDGKIADDLAAISSSRRVSDAFMFVCMFLGLTDGQVANAGGWTIEEIASMRGWVNEDWTKTGIAFYAKAIADAVNQRGGS